MKEKMSREELFEKIPVAKAIFTLTIPMVLGSIVSMLYNLADTYFVGMLNDPVQNAAVTLAAPAMTLFYAVTNLFGVGASSVMSRALGLKDIERVKRASATGIYFGLFCAALLSVFTLIFNEPFLKLLGTKADTYEATSVYMFWTVCIGAVPGIMNILFGYLLRAEGQSLQASIGTMSGCFLNIILDPIFILPWGLNKGAGGAAEATFISNCAACLYFIVLLMVKRDKTCVCLNPRYISFKKNVVSEIFIVGIPGVFQNILNVVSMTVLNNLAAVDSSEAVASIGIASKINQLPVQVIFGFTQGVMPLIGYNYASGNNARMKETIRKTFMITMSVLTIVTLAFVFAGAPIIRMFMDNDEIVATGKMFLRGFGISLPFMCVDFLVVGVSQSFGMGKHALIFSFLRKAFLEIPLVIVYNHFFGTNGMAFGQCSAEIVMAVIAGFVLMKLMRDADRRFDKKLSDETDI